MLAKVWTCAVVGLEGELVQVEVDIARQGIVKLTIVGLPDTAVQEAGERVRAAVRNSGLIFPPRRITVNLAPAEMRKSGPAYDLPIAIGVLLASEQITADARNVVFLGELSLDGTLRHLQGVLPMVGLARERGIRTVFVPAVDAAEAALVDGIEIIPVRTLAELVAHLKGEVRLAPLTGGVSVEDAADPEPQVDLAHIKGQEHARRALEVAAAGGHNLLRLRTDYPHDLRSGRRQRSTSHGQPLSRSRRALPVPAASDRSRRFRVVRPRAGSMTRRRPSIGQPASAPRSASRCWRSP
jgi:magnesium chelatase family protein